MTSNKEVEFDIGVVWAGKLYWYLKAKDSKDFGLMFTGKANIIQVAFQSPIRHKVVDPEEWEGSEYGQVRLVVQTAPADNKIPDAV
jgi:hypothetical protein